MVLLLWQHEDMTGISPQVVQSYKCFNDELNSCLLSMQNNQTRVEKYKRQSCWYCHTVVPFGWQQEQFNDWSSSFQYYSTVTKCAGTFKSWCKSFKSWYCISRMWIPIWHTLFELSLCTEVYANELRMREWVELYPWTECCQQGGATGAVCPGPPVWGGPNSAELFPVHHSHPSLASLRGSFLWISSQPAFLLRAYAALMHTLV